MPDTVLQKFYKFKAAFVSSSLPDCVLLDLIESYINSDSDDVTVEPAPVFDGQLSLFDSAI